MHISANEYRKLIANKTPSQTSHKASPTASHKATAGAARKAHFLEHKTPYKSRLEADFAAELELRRRADEILLWEYEPMSFRLGERLFYTPDFMVLTQTREMILYEVKGSWKAQGASRSRVKVKALAAKFWYLRIEGVTRCNGQWNFETF